MKTMLVGSTGFVGGNLAASHAFDGAYHSMDIEGAFGAQPELLVYAGLPAAKYLANTDPAGDLAVVEQAFRQIGQIAPRRLVLISTVDVYAAPQGVDEDTPADEENPAAYGRNRAKLERMVRTAYADALIVRLPGLFGKGLKKNFLYDMLTVTPAMLKAEKYEQLAAQSTLVREAYAPARAGFYALRGLDARAAHTLRTWFAAQPFNALSFTDSRAEYQFYDLSHLWGDICTALDAGLTLLNLSTQPISAREVYARLADGRTNGGQFTNELPGAPARYDMRSRHAALFGGANGWCYEKETVLRDLRRFMDGERAKQADREK